jgi:hypothetical protein
MEKSKCITESVVTLLLFIGTFVLIDMSTALGKDKNSPNKTPLHNKANELQVSSSDKQRLLGDINVIEDNFRTITTSPLTDIGAFYQYTPMRGDLARHQNVWENVVKDNSKSINELQLARECINNTDMKGYENHIKKAFEIRQRTIEHFDEIKNSEIRLLREHVEAATRAKDIVDKLKEIVPDIDKILEKGPAKVATYVYDRIVKGMQDDLRKVKAAHGKLRIPTYTAVYTESPRF